MSDNVTVDVNDLFFELTENLNNCRQLIRVLLAFKGRCSCLKEDNELNEDFKRFLDIYEKQRKPEEELSFHKKDLKSRDKHFCDICRKCFGSSSALSKHRERHEKEKPFKCEFCDKWFLTRDHVRGHTLRTHTVYCDDQIFTVEEVDIPTPVRNERNVYPCAKCGAEFSPESAIRRHLYSHWPNIKCLFCDKRFAQKTNAREHFLRIHNKDPELRAPEEPKKDKFEVFECQWEGCGKRFRDKHILMRHKGIHSGEKPFQCEFCEKAFRQKSNLEDHCLRIHFQNELPETESVAKINASGLGSERLFFFDGRQYVCRVCDQRFGTFSSVRRHLFVHQKRKPFKCAEKECERTFSQKSNMISHYLRIHKRNGRPAPRDHVIYKQKSDRKFGCERCHKRFSQESELESHVKAVHAVDNPFECHFPGCESRFRNPSHLELHIRRHSQEFKCDFNDCCYRTHSQTALRVHVSKHEGRTLFTCEICSLNFDFLGSLNTHKQKVHSIEFPLSCDWPGCPNRYKSVAGIRKHRRLHTGETPYSCSWPECGQSFAVLQALKVHVTKHTLERPFKCSQCMKGYATKDNLRTHLNKVHKTTVRNIDINQNGF